MNGIGGFTVIRGKGNTEMEVVMNGVVNEEIKRLRAQELAEMEAQRKEFEKEMEWMNMIKRQRDRLLEEKCNALRVRRRETLRERTREKIAFVLACLLCWGDELGLWEYVGNDEEWR